MTSPIDYFAPYDGHAVWHTHRYPPDGASHPESEDERGRIDAIEDRYGRFFVWDADLQRLVGLRPNDRADASALAQMVCRTRYEALQRALTPR